MTKHFGELKILVNSFNPMIISGLVLTLPIASVVSVVLLFNGLYQLSKNLLGRGAIALVKVLTDFSGRGAIPLVSEAIAFVGQEYLSSCLCLAFIVCTITRKIAHLHWLFSPAKVTIFSIYHGHQPFYF